MNEDPEKNDISNIGAPFMFGVLFLLYVIMVMVFECLNI